MHPKELCHMALAVASAARLGGFQATADALLALAAACEDEARRVRLAEVPRSPGQLFPDPLSDQEPVLLCH
jgi:hypothetical protein